MSAHRINTDLYALTAAPWKANFRDGATAEVLLGGKTTTMRGELIRDPAVVGDLSHRVAESYGVKRAQRAMGLKFRDQRIPTPEEFTETAEREHIVAVKLTRRVSDQLIAPLTAGLSIIPLSTPHMVAMVR